MKPLPSNPNLFGTIASSALLRERNRDTDWGRELPQAGRTSRLRRPQWLRADLRSCGRRQTRSLSARSWSSELQRAATDQRSCPFARNVFTIEDGVVHHTYVAYARDLGVLWDRRQLARLGAARPRRRRVLVVPSARPVRGQLPVTLAHVVGVPFEQWLPPLVAAAARSGGVARCVASPTSTAVRSGAPPAVPSTDHGYDFMGTPSRAREAATRGRSCCTHWKPWMRTLHTALRVTDLDV